MERKLGPSAKKGAGAPATLLNPAVGNAIAGAQNVGNSGMLSPL